MIVIDGSNANNINCNDSDFNENNLDQKYFEFAN